MSPKTKLDVFLMEEVNLIAFGFYATPYTTNINISDSKLGTNNVVLYLQILLQLFKV